jgi:hypothetical protein
VGREALDFGIETDADERFGGSAGGSQLAMEGVHARGSVP